MSIGKANLTASTRQHYRISIFLHICIGSCLAIVMDKVKGFGSHDASNAHCSIVAIPIDKARQDKPYLIVSHTNVSGGAPSQLPRLGGIVTNFRIIWRMPSAPVIMIKYHVETQKQKNRIRQNACWPKEVRSDKSSSLQNAVFCSSLHDNNNNNNRID